MKAMCGSGWLCELGARPHLRSCAEGADCMVTSFSPFPVPFVFFFPSLLRHWRWPLTDTFLLSSMHLISSSLQPHVHSRFIPIHVFCYCAAALWGWGILWAAELTMAHRLFESEIKCVKGEKKHKWIDEHGKRGVSTWPFEFKHMSNVVKTS